ncbi:hypothetical protein ACFS07_13285 [Undibacterium arcticum]
MISFNLPMAPTINHYYGNRPHGGKFIKPAGVAFRKEVAVIVKALGLPTLTGRVRLGVKISPATRARQDLDNRLKKLAGRLDACRRMD